MYHHTPVRQTSDTGGNRDELLLSLMPPALLCMLPAPRSRVLWGLQAISVAVSRPGSSSACSSWPARSLSTQSGPGNVPAYDLSSGPVYTIWGANTGVGKTLSSMGIARAARNLKVPFLYIKPVQTGFPSDSDARSVARACGAAETHGPHASALLRAGSDAAAPLPLLQPTPPPATASVVKTLYAWSRACGPHQAVAEEGRAASDEQILSDIVSELSGFTGRLGLGAAAGPVGVARAAAELQQQPAAQMLALVETAGGVSSPAPSGELQCDMLRPLRLPCVLVGDARLGGISATLSAYDSLTLRGYDVDAVLLLTPPSPSPSPGGASSDQPALDNAASIRRHLSKSVHRLGMKTEVLSLPGCPPPPAAALESPEALDPAAALWLQQTEDGFKSVVQLLQQCHAARVARLGSMADQASRQLWWPFTQHASLHPGAVQVIDSRCGEFWQVYGKGAAGPTPGEQGCDSPAAAAQLSVLYDGCSSWWTQAVPAHLQPEIAQAVAYATGRYMHVMFPENAHEPAVLLADRLLATVGSGWAQRVFFSDDGSTAVEVALKMAFRKFLHDRQPAAAEAEAQQQQQQQQATPELQVLGLQNSYHGDTLGAMDCVAPSVFNSPQQAAWYRGRGLFLHPPYLALSKGRWGFMDAPAWLQETCSAQDKTWGSLGEVLDAGRDDSELSRTYRSYIEAEVERHEASSHGRIAATIIEPLVQGAGGMLFIDPQFQRAMVQVCRARNIPVIFDEVMTGMYRLGVVSAAQLLRCQPDIACYAKILTAGVVPMAVTLTSAGVFEAFSGPSKLQALLHGHSYTAYPVGCAAALAALDLLSSPKTNPNLCAPQLPPPTPGPPGGSSVETGTTGRQTVPGGAALPVPSACCLAKDRGMSQPCTAPCGWLLPLWNEPQVHALSHHPAVLRVVAVGTILAVELTIASSSADASRESSASYGGYGPGGLAVKVARQLRQRHGIFCRPLGAVVYMMVPPTTDRRRCQALASALMQELDAVSLAGRQGGGAPEEGVVV